jgi:serine/threonine protein phosphatase PrpC
MDPDMTTCPSCGEALAAAANFCEACGTRIGDAPVSAPPSPTADEASPISAATNRHTAVPEVVAASRPPCRECGGPVGDDLYCERCGTKAPSERDHFEATPAPWVAGVCDRGQRHSRNEDAMAVFADGSRAALVVCDGVSSSKDSDVSSLAAAKAALAVLKAPMPKGMGVPESGEAAVQQVFTQAAEAANTAVIAHADPSAPNPASCTFVAAVVDGRTVWSGGVGDSRAYFLPDAGAGRVLTEDDSMAQLLMAGGSSRAEAEQDPRAHAITRWLGQDSPDIVPRVTRIDVEEPGWVLVCSDGLWNYASEAEALQSRIAGAGTSDALALAHALVDFANAQGGHDNITAVLARVGDNAGDGEEKDTDG